MSPKVSEAGALPNMYPLDLEDVPGICACVSLAIQRPLKSLAYESGTYC